MIKTFQVFLEGLPNRRNTRILKYEAFATVIVVYKEQYSDGIDSAVLLNNFSVS